MPFDYPAYKKRMLAHILWMVDMGHEQYAIATAAQYERDSFGALEGLHAKVLQVLEKREAASEDRASIPPGQPQPKPQERAALGSNARSEGQLP